MTDRTEELPEVPAADPDELLAQLRVTLGHDFLAAKALLDQIEQLAAAMNATDRLHLGRLMYSAAHAVEQSSRKGRAA